MAINKNDFKNAEGNYEAKNTLMDAVIDGINENEANISLLEGNTIVTLYNTGTTLPLNAVKQGWASLPQNSAAVPVTLCIIRVASSNLALAVVTKNSDTIGKVYMISGASDAGIHSLIDGEWS